MGTCASCTKEKRQAIILDRFDEQPEDTLAFQDTTLPTLSFSAQLTKIKIKRCIYSSMSMKFSIAGVEEFMLPPKDFSSQVAKWELEHVFHFQMTEYQMRKKFLIITFLDKDSQEVGKLKINLYLLATGPFHQDFALNLKEDKTARLSFNLKIAQVIKMNFQFLQAQMIPYEKEYPGDKFAFSVRTIMGHITEYTNQSYVVSIAFDEEQYENQKKSRKNSDKLTNASSSNHGSGQVKNNISSFEKESHQVKSLADDKKQPPKRKLKSKKSIVANLRGGEIQVDRNNIKWTSSHSSQMPSFNTQIALFDMHSSAFHIIYWKIADGKDEENQDNIKAQCFVSINKLLNYESKVVYDQNTVPYDVRTIQLEQKNWSHGKEVGLSKFKIKFQIQKHIKQMQVCVRTEQGILKSSPVFSRQEKTGNREITLLQELAVKVQNQFIDLAKNRKQNASTLSIRRNIDQIIKLINEEKELLKTTVKESIMFFNYKDQKQLLKSQQQLIEIGFKTKTYINQNIDEISSACFSLLFALMKRGELSLAHLGFNLESHSMKDIPEKSVFKTKKVNIALKYQELLNHLMTLALFSLNFKGHQSQKQFAELFCALAYFRVPSFRKHVLKAISHEDDPEIEQWRGTEFNLYQKGDSRLLVSISEEKNTYQLLFNWQNNFYKYIQDQEKYKKNIMELENILQDNQWQERIQKRRGAFYSFIRYWCDYVESIAIYSKNLKWKYFPGYNKILHAFLVQMKNKQLSDYSDRMEKACVSLLHNEKLLNPFIAILFKKTDVNNSLSTLKMLDFLQLFFTAINQKKKSIPTTFDYNFFFKGFKMVLETSHCYSLGKALLILYNHFNIFSLDFQFYISIYLMGKLFFRLFLHWSQNVRTIFHHLLYIRIHKLTQYTSRNLKGFSRNERAQLRNRYDKLMIILENANQLKKKQEKTQKIKHQNEYYKKMKKKLYNSKKHKESKDFQDSDYQMSIRELSFNPRKNSQNDERFIDQLSKPKLARYNSQVMTKNLKIAIQEAANKKDEIIPLKSTANIEGLSESEITPLQRDFENQKTIRRINLLTEEEGEIWQMTKKEAQYISRSLQEYSSIHELFLKHLSKSNNVESVPVVRLEMAFDYDDIRPEGIDEW